MPRQIITTANAPSSPLAKIARESRRGRTCSSPGIVEYRPEHRQSSPRDTIQDPDTASADELPGHAPEVAAPAWTMSPRWEYCSPVPPTSLA